MNACMRVCFACGECKSLHHQANISILEMEAITSLRSTLICHVRVCKVKICFGGFFPLRNFWIAWVNYQHGINSIAKVCFDGTCGNRTSGRETRWTIFPSDQRAKGAAEILFPGPENSQKKKGNLWGRSSSLLKTLFTQIAHKDACQRRGGSASRVRLMSILFWFHWQVDSILLMSVVYMGSHPLFWWRWPPQWPWQQGRQCNSALLDQTPKNPPMSPQRQPRAYFRAAFLQGWGLTFFKCSFLHLLRWAFERIPPTDLARSIFFFTNKTFLLWNLHPLKRPVIRQHHLFTQHRKSFASVCLQTVGTVNIELSGLSKIMDIYLLCGSLLAVRIGWEMHHGFLKKPDLTRKL